MGGFEKLFDFIVKGSIAATILGIIILIVEFILKKRVSPKIIYSLWVIVLLKFLIPYGPESSLSIYSVINNPIKSYFIQSNNEQEVKKSKINTNEGTKYSSFLEKDINLNKENDKGKVIKFNEVINHNQGLLKDIGIFSWLLIVTLLGCYGFFSYIKLRRLEGETENNTYKEILEEILRKNNIKRKVKIIESDLVGTPSIYGVINPKIIMPKDLEKKLSKEELKYVFLHEITHLKNGHTLISIIGLIIKIIHWFNPFIYIFLKVIDKNCELACDYDILKKLDERENIKYGNTILKVIESIKNNKRFMVEIPIGINKKEVKGRLEMIVENKKFGRTSLVIGGIALVVVSVIGLTSKITKSDDRLAIKSEKDIISIQDKIFMDGESKGKEANKVSEDIINVLKEYVEALNNKELNNIKKLVSINFYKVKENELAQEIYLSSEKLGTIKSIEIEEVINDSNVVLFVKCKNKNEVFTLLKENNQWKIDGIGSTFNNVDHRKEEKIAENKINEYLREKHYKVQMNSGMGGMLKLPVSFNEIKREIKVGKIIKEFNELSIENGYDFSNYLNEEIYFKSIDLEDNKSVKTVIIFVKDENVIGLFNCNMLESEKFRSLINIIGK
ncbi:M56 family metallopeptidase [Clostridium sp.]|uniref:M56 family metallopeptidase n=1 Tax=Clostridium sp. TaxID=1506 RepID=UPI003991AB18